MSTSTPLMEQYWKIKNQHQDAILFFRMGDFFELFYDDAKIASKVLGLTLTSRGHGTVGDVPLAGFPHHALDGYLAKMIKAGYKVAICEQVEDPKKAKKLVKREIVEVVTPGTVLTDDLLESKRNNYLVAIYLKAEICGFSRVDLSTGEFEATEFPKEDLQDQLLNSFPSEVLVSETQASFVQSHVRNLVNFTLTKRDDWLFSRDYAYELLTEHFKVVSLKGFGCEDLDAGLRAAGAILHYLKENKKSDLAHIRSLSRFYPNQFMVLDPATLRNLEIFSSLANGGKEGSLITIIDQTVTPIGGRLLRHWIQNPLRDAQKIKARLDAVEEFVADENLRQQIRTVLKKFGDLERLISRICTRRANARDLLTLGKSIALIPEIKSLISKSEIPLLSEINGAFLDLEEVAQRIEQAIVDDPPLAITEGGIIKEGYNAALDELRQIAFSGKNWIANLQAVERERTGIPSLKVGYNKVFGYYIEVTKPHLAKVPQDFIRKQTLVNAERFITPELKEYEEKILGAEEKMASLEYELFDEVRQFVVSHAEAIQKNAHLIAQLDIFAALAEVAVANNYHKPEVSDSDRIVIEEGRHPVVEKLLPLGESFVPNDTTLDNQQNQIMVITGPNMAGKSTYIRQVGLIVLLAQMGSFVPARSAKIGIVDRIFTRVGASDNLAGGESTFLVEMNEMANILNNASSNSLILLDEIGRGTSTFDGLSIAWAVVEFLHNNHRVAAKTLFATHYHELTELELVLPRVKNYNVAIKEWGDRIVFLRKVTRGGCDHSYGIQVARLAGLPNEVIERAKEVLANLESEALTPSRVPKLALHRKRKKRVPVRQLDFFAKQEARLAEELQKLDINNLTPLQALTKINELKKLLDGKDRTQ